MKYNKGISYVLKALCTAALATAAALTAFNLPSEVQTVSAVTISMNGDENGMIKNKDREGAYVILQEHIKALKRRDLSAAQKAKLDEIMYDANVYIANTEMTVEQLGSYVATVEARLTEVASGNLPDAGQFLFIDNTSLITSASYSKPTTITLSIVNLGQTEISDIVINPVVDTSRSKWPFEITTASDARMIKKLLPAASIEQSVGLAQKATWNFIVASDAKSGVYPLTFHARYYRGGAVEEADLKTYIKIKGKASSGQLAEEGEEGKELPASTPRIIVTGFKTVPENVYAGDTFLLTINVENTSRTTSVSNIQFDLEAAKEGEKEENTYEAFLPTSGSSTVYVPSIAAGDSTDIEIEMTARADLTQKPYVVTLNMEYEDYKHNPYKAQSNVSIPVHQEARVDTGDAEVSPSPANVGDQVNVMFPVYNKGKTTLYNVSVSFNSPSLEGGNTFLGQLEPGATGNVDSMVNCVAPSEDETGLVIAEISYEDDAGHVTVLEKEIYIPVFDNEFEDMGGMNELDLDGDGIFDGADYDGDGVIDEYYEQQSSGFKAWMVVVPVVIIFVIVLIVVIVILRKKKKKKLEAELAAIDDET